MDLCRRFLSYVRPYRSLGIAASLSFVLSGFLGAYPIQIFKRPWTSQWATPFPPR